MIPTLFAAAVMASPPQPTYPSPPVPRPDLRWLAGYWLRCDHGLELTETWSDWRVPYMHGMRLISSSGPQWVTIGPSGGGDAQGISLFWRLGAEETEYVLVRAGRREVVFENAAIVYPRRFIYRLDGRRLVWRIEGTGRDGQPESAETVYRAAPLNQHCPPSTFRYRDPDQP